MASSLGTDQPLENTVSLCAFKFGIWYPIESAPKGRKLLCSFISESCHRRTAFCEYIRSHTLEDDDEDWADEFEDGFFVPEGWYECIWSDDRGGGRLTPTHWMPLPPAPQEQGTHSPVISSDQAKQFDEAN